MAFNKSAPLISHIPISEKVFVYLKEAIIKNELKPREIIYEKDIAKIFNVSTTPVREALKRLAAEGYVDIKPYKPASVAEPLIKDFQNGGETMFVLDSYACKRAIKELSDEEIEKLNEMTLDMEKCYSPDKLEEYLDKNAQIHIKIWESLKDDFFFSTVTQAFEHWLKKHRYHLYSQWAVHNSYLKKSVRIHKRYIKALKERDSSHIARVVKDHWAIYWK